MKPERGSRRERTVVALLLAVGAALRLWQYFAATSLWVDEIALAENILRTPLRALLVEPLALDQVAPPGFLAAVKLATATFGPSELALRLLPLLSGLAALVLFAILARRTRAGWTSVFAIALFAFSPPMITYSAEVKPYSTDVCVSVALTIIALGLRAGTPGAGSRFLAAAFVGAVAVWFSAGAVLVLTGLGAVLAIIALRGSREGRPAALAVMLGVWAASAAAAVALGLHSLSPSTREYMQQFWQPSLPRPTVLVLVLIVTAVVWRSRPAAAPFLMGPAAAALAAATAHFYPFSGRAILFLTPAILLAAADALGWIVAGLTLARVPQAVGIALAAVAVALAVRWRPPVYRSEDTRPVLASLAGKRQAGDAMYVYYGAEKAVRFYGPRVGVDPKEATFGGCHRGQPREYLREVDRFRGLPRVWVVFAHASPSEQEALQAYLRAIGTRRGTLEATGAAAELYDLSDPERLQAAIAETYAVSESDPAVGKRFGCGHGALSPTPPDWK